ncbi:putative ferrichrome binding protein of ABC transporter [Gluconacetobacter diazotrophicus PA1 5]|uniref:ABC transporter substrate-binding protein n=1 Tax=Gluconacetobacter diazotrophicus TaxID=33996 RepID=A0A7W4I3Q1_GLUDI|nr:ABC transporter substrate-binding protein [Gluconacetobacter diazotrophicus]ACI51122.1 putative ferrichrome binding protein of ABC transporter [Gluconacetobacter diazotrophicus PA1 5]MBB2155164.1 ABC transporter substrate-binding protein [Gluconacetobacter diazotrophicus]TWB07603.1 iron complex transport system substrate-binding protein [Gluconacetobacter diazotrophicus]
MKRALWGMVAGLLAWTSAGQGRPLPRVASLNLCTDQLVLMLAEPEQIVGLSPIARDCWSSVLCEQARHAPVMRPTAENIVSARPDVVLGGVYTAAVAMQAAREEGARVIAFPPVKALADIPAQIMTVANAVGAPERGRALADAFVVRLASLSADRRPDDPTAAIYAANGFVMHGGSLPDDVLAHAGFRNYATTMDLAPSPRLPMEVLIAHPPDLLILDRSGQGHSLAQALLDHPALQQAFAGRHHLDLPARLWLCGLPQTLDSIAMLRAARQDLGPSP